MGLGNPGQQYKDNRHNFGFMVVDRLADAQRLNFQSGGKPYLWCNKTMSIKGKSVSACLAKPLTYMNKSGIAAKKILKESNLLPDNILVIYDDIDLPLGRVRLRPNGSPGGHNGVKSIADQLQSRDFPRLRLGIGPQPQGVPAEEFVLENFKKSEMTTVSAVIEIGTNIALEYLVSDFDTIMTKYNNIDLRETQTGVA